MADARRIGVPLDFSPGSKYALQWGLQNIAKEGDAVICIVVNKKLNEIGDMHLWQDTGSPMIPAAEFAAVKYGIQDDLQIPSLLQKESEERQLEVFFKVYWGDAREKICDAVVDIPLDCIVMGSRGLGTVKRAMLGSVSNYVVNNAPCPVTVVKLSGNAVKA